MIIIIVVVVIIIIIMMIIIIRLEANSRSLSTWVAVGDVQSSTSQLPSPQVSTITSQKPLDFLSITSQKDEVL